MQRTHARLIRLSVLALLLSACAQFPVNPPLERWEPHALMEAAPASGRRPDLLLIVALSGGGTRAASFGYGVLEQLRDTTFEQDGTTRRLLDEIDLITGVSGGSFVAAYYGLHGDGIFEHFEERFLRRNVQRGLVLGLLNPVNWFRLASPRFGRSDLATEYYDEHVFKGATFADLAQGPGADVAINATDMVRGNRFSFRQVELDYLCSDLSKIPIARAVAASAAFPGPLTPVILRSYAGTCGFEPPAWIEETLAAGGPSRRRLRQARLLKSYLDPDRPYVYLLDGGIADNLGIRAAVERVAGAGSFRRVLEWGGMQETRQILMIVVNAEVEPELEKEGRMLKAGLAGLVGTASGIQIRSLNFEMIELVRSSFEQWARQLTQYHGEPVEFRLVDLHFDRVTNPELRRKLKNVPTSLSLPDEDVDLLRETGRELLRESPVFREAVERIRQP